MASRHVPSLWDSTDPARPRSVALDTETTGLGPSRRLLQLAVVDANSEEIVCNMFFNPGAESDPGALAVHGLTPSRLQAYDAITPEDARAIHDLLAPARIIAHNARFDLDTIMAELREFGMAFVPEDVVDTGLLAKRELSGCVPETQRMPSLDAAAAWVGLAPRVGHHDAVSDARLCLALYNKIIAELARAQPRTRFQPPRHDGPFIRARSMTTHIARYWSVVYSSDRMRRRPDRQYVDGILEVTRGSKASYVVLMTAGKNVLCSVNRAGLGDLAPGQELDPIGRYIVEIGERLPSAQYHAIPTAANGIPNSTTRPGVEQRRALHAIRTIGHGERQAMHLTTNDLKRAIRTELHIAIAAVRTRDQTLGRVRDLERENDALRGRLRCLEESLGF